MTTKEKRQFAEICNGYGWDLVDQVQGGLFCSGCGSQHQSPTRMYGDGLRFQGVPHLRCAEGVLHYHSGDIQETSDSES